MVFHFLILVRFHLSGFIFFLAVFAEPHRFICGAAAARASYVFAHVRSRSVVGYDAVLHDFV